MCLGYVTYIFISAEKEHLMKGKNTKIITAPLTSPHQPHRTKKKKKKEEEEDTTYLNNVSVQTGEAICFPLKTLF